MSSSRRYEREPYRAVRDYTAAELIERAENEARKLPSYDANDEESTARHNIPADIHFHNHVHPSKPDSDPPDGEIELGPVKVRGIPRWMTIAIVATGVVIAAATAAASHFAAK